MIEAKNVGLTYPEGTVALKNVNLIIQPGEVVYLTGPSGSGKTSLLKLLMGMEYPTSGELSVLEQFISKNNQKDIRQLRRLLGPVFQEFKLIRGRTAMENVMLGMRFFNYSIAEIKERANSALLKVGLGHKAFSLVENLSWGERQRVAIARAVARKPKLILADEPTGNLDTKNALNILELLISFKDQNTAIIITTHATHLIDQKDGRLIYVEAGRIFEEGLGLNI